MILHFQHNLYKVILKAKKHQEIQEISVCACACACACVCSLTQTSLRCDGYEQESFLEIYTLVVQSDAKNVYPLIVNFKIIQY
jgi:hypothetical protein